jgi:GTPase-associated system helical domain
VFKLDIRLEQQSMVEILQKYIDNGLILTNGDDTQFNALRAAAESLASYQIEDRSRIIAHTIAALNPDIQEGHPAFDDAERFIKSTWNTVKSVSKGKRLIALFRSVLLQALDISSAKDESANLVFWHTASTSIAPRLEKKENAIIHPLIEEVGNRFEMATSAKWMLKPFTLPTKAALPPWPDPPIDAAKTAAYNESLKSYDKNILNYIGGLTKIQNDNILLVEKKTSLLWWNYTLYSPTLAKGYREVPNELAAVFAAFDLSQTSGAFAPHSVEYLLAGVLESLGLHGKKQSMRTTINKLHTHIETLQPKLGDAQSTSGRTTMIDFIRRSFTRFPSDIHLKEQFGDSVNSEVSLSSVALRLFKEFQAELAAGKGIR